MGLETISSRVWMLKSPQKNAHNSNYSISTYAVYAVYAVYAQRVSCWPSKFYTSPMCFQLPQLRWTSTRSDPPVTLLSVERASLKYINVSPKCQLPSHQRPSNTVSLLSPPNYVKNGSSQSCKSYTRRCGTLSYKKWSAAHAFKQTDGNR